MSDGRSDAKYDDKCARTPRHIKEQLSPTPGVGRLIDELQKRDAELLKEDYAKVGGSYPLLPKAKPEDIIEYKTPEMNMGGIKYDQDKVEYHHMPAEALEEINKALTYGSKKYSDYNWRGGFKWSRPFNACMRHLWAYWRGEDIDKESGCYHLACAAANVIFLLQFLLDKKGLDNRYKKGEGNNGQSV